MTRFTARFPIGAPRENKPKVILLTSRLHWIKFCDDDDSAAIQEDITSFVLNMFVVTKTRDGGLEKQAGIAIKGEEVLFGIPRFIVRGPSGPLVAPLGSSLVLPCYVDEPLLMEDLEVEWRRTDSETLVHLFQDGESRPEAQSQDYQDRAHFFTEEIKHRNFSLRLDHLRAEDEGRYTCTVHSQLESGETEVQIKDVGSDRSISASVGEDVTLNCSVDSHIKPEHLDEVSWKKIDKENEDEDVLVLLYQNNKTFPGSSDERYRDRAEFFTAEIPKGNFSVQLKSVRTEDKGVYMCHVFAGRHSANATVVLDRLGESIYK
ncbi:butyrophilin-like protein [Pimephales promelas]|nr:butyrophilin-like protein [Pimephales promelas]